MWAKIIAAILLLLLGNFRGKWLRTLYAKDSGEENELSSDSDASKRSKKWYITETMSLLHAFLGQHRRRGCNASIRANNETQIDEDQVGEESHDKVTSRISDSHQEKTFKMKKAMKDSAAYLVAGSVIDFLKGRTSAKNEVAGSEVSTFLSSLALDVEKMTPRRQRYFKEKVLGILNELLDEQENEAESIRRPPPRYSQYLPASPYYPNMIYTPISFERPSGMANQPQQLLSLPSTESIATLENA